MIEKQVIVIWYTPDERLPEPYTLVAATISGRRGRMIYERTLCIVEWADDGCGWMPAEGPDFDELIVHAWCDLEIFKG